MTEDARQIVMRPGWTGPAALVCLAAAIACQAALTSIRDGAGVTQSVIAGTADEKTRSIHLASYGLYLPRGEFAERAMAFLGGVRSDMYWIKAAYYATRQLERPEARLPLLDELYDAMLEADPYWYSAAITGARILAVVSREPEHAERLLLKALHYRPRQWRLWYELAGIYLFWPGHQEQAAEAFRRAALMPAAPGMLFDVAAPLYSEAGRHQMAVKVTQQRIERCREVYGPDSSYVSMALRDLKEFEARLFQRWLNNAAKEFRSRYGRMPRNLGEMVEEGLVSKEDTREPYGKRWLMDPDSGIIVSEGLGILEGCRMKAVLERWISAYRKAHGEYPGSIRGVVGWVEQTSDPEARRLFGSPPRFRTHPITGEWDYDPESGRITLPEGYRLEDLFEDQSPDSASPSRDIASPTT